MNNFTEKNVFISVYYTHTNTIYLIRLIYLVETMINYR